MATEYELKLKAVLDDSDVQKKLQQLKKQQVQQEGGGQPGQGALGNIGQAIQRLNTSIASLEHAIEKLAAAQGKPQQAGAASPALAVPAALGRGGRQAEATYRGAPLSNVRSGYISTRAMAGDIASGFSIWDPNIKTLRNISHQFRNFSRHGWTAKQLGSALMPYNDYAPAEAFLEREGRWVGWDKGGYDMSGMQTRLNAMRKNYIKTNPLLSREAQEVGPAKLSPRLKAQMRLGSALAFTALAGGVENYAEATGQTGLKKGASLVQNIGMGAATGALVGGPVGALVGGGIGALNSAFAELADRARETADALADQAARVKSGRRFDIDMKDFEQQRQDKEMLKKQATGTASEKSEAMAYFRTQLDDTKKKYENVRANMEKSGIAAEGGVEAYEKRTQKLLELRGKDDAEVKQRQETVNVYKDQAYWLKKHSARIEQLEGIVPKAPKARELATSRFGLLGDHPEIKDWTRYGAMGGARGAAAAQQAELFKEALANLKAPDMTPINSLASQGFMIGNGLGDEAMLDETNKYLNEIAHLTREIKDKEGEAAAYS